MLRRMSQNRTDYHRQNQRDQDPNEMLLVRKIRSQDTYCKHFRNRSQTLESTSLLGNRERKLLLAKGLIVITYSKVHYLTKALDFS